MTSFKMIAGALVLSAAGAGWAFAAPRSIELPQETMEFRPGQGSDIAQNNCMACHSVDYIAFQPPKKGRAFWEAEVQKMINVYRAPITEADAKVITDYLANTY
jgi:sulfite dehydrogenase (cytochrome) subunit B